METDKTTLADLSMFNTEDDLSVFSKLDCCLTTRGREKMYHHFTSTLKNIEQVKGIQDTLKFIGAHRQHWPSEISNGTLMVVEKFYETAVDEIPSNPGAVSTFTYKLFHGPDFSLVKYSTGHAFDFIHGMKSMVQQLLEEDTPIPLQKLLKRIKFLTIKEPLEIVEKHKKISELKIPAQLKLANFLRYHYKQQVLELLDIYAQLDAWYGMAQAVHRFGLVFPEFIESDEPILSTKGLYHILLTDPVDYDLSLNPTGNFIFLTGANMAGKSTFIKSVGTAVFLAHIGMGVPAASMRLSFFDGLLSNINVVDNLVRGESYFYNEVQRIKATVTKVSDGRKWLILIDELFKGTNVQDAMKCSSTVIEGLLKIKNSLFILSTHLYEIGQDLERHPNIIFKYFETAITGDQLQFSYHLKDGISNDRLGYLILKKEGVVRLLEEL